MKIILKKSICILLTLVLTLSVMSMLSFAATPLAYDSAFITDGNIVSDMVYPSSYRYGTVEYSYLQANSDGTLSRITSNGSDVYIDTYTSDFNYISSKTIKAALPIFGGFYSGSEYNFCIFGQNNPDENDSVEVFKIVKYTKNWAEVDSVSLKGANTTIPFDAGSARMHENNGNLYIHTCHEMYEFFDGYNHQANVQIHIKIDTMEVFYSYYEIGHISGGYCSHSFDQYIRSDGDYVYAVDHGDAHLRSVTICKKQPSGKMVKYTEALKIYGTEGSNTTGVTLGGFEISDDTLIIAGNTSSQQEGQKTSIRNIFVTVTDKELNNTRFVQLTDFTEPFRISEPQLVKIDDNRFVVIWNEFEADDSSAFTNMCAAMIDSQGNIIKEIKTDAIVSDCDPIVKDGKIIWSSNDAFYSLQIEKFSDYDGYFGGSKYYGDFEYAKHSNGIIITAYNGNDSYVQMPQEIEGLPIVSIGHNAFKNKYKLSEIILPEGLITIGDDAFYGCEKLKYVYLPKGITTIGEFAFANCHQVEYIVIPKNIKIMKRHSFPCSKLENIYYEGSESDWSKLDKTDVFPVHPAHPDVPTYTVHYNCNPDHYRPDFGDVNLDGKYSSQDALIVLQHSTGLKYMTEAELNRADVSKDGKINSGDALLILQRSTGLIDKF